jgi:hypothetical protein
MIKIELGTEDHCSIHAIVIGRRLKPLDVKLTPEPD